MDSTWTVSVLNRYIRTALETDYRLQDLTVEGELSNVSRPASGHLYFTLNDASAQLRCVMWKPAAARMVYRPRDGERVYVHGAVSVYEAGGQYQLYADSIRPAGAGDLFRQFTELKARLEAEGLFANARPLPSRPGRVAIVTSASAAALRDVLNVIRRRWPVVEVIVCPTPVQGDDAPPRIVAALAAANRLQPDVILLARGGGSMEDLWAFNDERVVRAVAASTAPIVTGVGHETDFTLADFAADVRAPTPSAAAELATPNREAFFIQIRDLRLRATERLRAQLRDSRWALAERAAALRGLSPRARLANLRQRTDDLSLRIQHAAAHQLALHRQRTHGLARRLAALNPLAVLNRGYAVVTRAATGQVVRTAAQVGAGEALFVRLSDGTISVEVKNA